MNTPYKNSAASLFIAKRIAELSHRKTQSQIAAEAGFVNPNMMVFLKNGRNKLPLDRIPSLAKALEVDPAFLMRLALEQAVGATSAQAILEIFGTPVSENEALWLNALREASQDSDPRPTGRTRAAFMALFEK